jgi:CheY-like chemotaxis protein
MSIEEHLAEFSFVAGESNPEKLRPKVLVVDDERVITDTLAMILSVLGYQSFVAYNGSEGLQKAREVKPDMIISGVKNGEGPNGVDMAIQIHDEMSETKFLLVSGMSSSADIFEKRLAEGHSFLTSVPLLAKPVEPKVLLRWCKSGGNPDSLCERT